MRRGIEDLQFEIQLRVQLLESLNAFLIVPKPNELNANLLVGEPVLYKMVYQSLDRWREVAYWLPESIGKDVETQFSWGSWSCASEI